MEGGKLQWGCIKSKKIRKKPKMKTSLLNTRSLKEDLFYAYVYVRQVAPIKALCF